MLYLPALNAIFLHVPRTGGTWVKQTLAAAGIATISGGGPGDHNLPAAIDPRYRLARRFAFVRHPLSWYQSVWRGLQSSWPHRCAVKALHRERSWSPVRLATYLAGDRHFDAFVTNILADEPGFVSRMFEWYTGPPGAPAVDLVGRTESLAEDLAGILCRLGWSGALPDVPPASASDAPAAPWDVGLRQALSESEAFGIRRWYAPDAKSPFGVTTE